MFYSQCQGHGSAGRDVGQWPHYCQINSPTPPPSSFSSFSYSVWLGHSHGDLRSVLVFFFCKPVVLLCCRTLVSLSLSSVSGVLPRQCKVLCAIPRFIGYKVEDPSRTKWGNDCLIENKDCKTFLQGGISPLGFFIQHIRFSLQPIVIAIPSYPQIHQSCSELLMKFWWDVLRANAAIALIFW